MKVLSIREPWASIIINGYKEYEFRSWKTNYRGKILIHASKNIEKENVERFKELNLNYKQGFIIGEAELVECIPVTKEFEEYKEKVTFIKADVSNEDEVAKMFNQIEKLDYLINNAGTNIDSYIETFDIQDFREILNVNLVGKVICTKHAIPLLKNSENASIVNIASRLGTKPCVEASAYCSAEAGVINFTQASALELSKYKIRVNAVSIIILLFKNKKIFKKIRTI